MMLYHRTASGAHRRPVRLLAGVSIVALLALGFLGNPPQVRAQVEWKDPVALPPISGTNATGRAAPAPLNPELDGSFPVSTSTQPTLVWKDVPAGTSQVLFKIVSLNSSNPTKLWSATAAVGSDGVARARVSPGILRQSRTYAWAASSVEAPAKDVGPFSLTVDVQRASVQPLWSLGDASVAQATGELVYQYQGPTVRALSGPVSWSLTHRASNVGSKGLPPGWNLAVSGTTGWEAINVNADGSVTLLNSTGGAVTYTKTGSNQWRPAVGRYASAGQATLLTENADGTFSATDGNRTVTVFSKPTVNTDGRPVQVWNLEAPTIQQHWASGRLVKLVDPVTTNTTVFIYGGEDGCATTTDPGFIKVPDGMLCGVLDWNGILTFIEYVSTPTGSQIGRFVAGLGAGPDAGVTDIGWDDSGRIVETRAPFTTRVVASGAVEGLGIDDERVFTQISYDALGRVSGVTAPQGLTQNGAVTTRVKASLTYAPFTATYAGDGANAGVIKQTWLDPLTFAKTRERDNLGNVVEYDYNPDGTLLRTTDQGTGTVTENRYDAQGRVTQQLGPTRDAITSPTAPHTMTAYDQDANGKPWTGLAVRYWDNAGFNGAPKDGTTGPIMPGTTGPVTSMSMNWASSPVGSGPWAARLSGLYDAPADGTYVFRNTTTAKLWVNSALCAPTCSVTLSKDVTASLLIDVVAPTGGAAGVNALVTTPAGTTAPIPTGALRPNYGLATSTTVREHKAGVGTTNLVSKFVYDPVTTQLLKTISPSGATQTRTYEPYDPATGQWGRSTGVIDASGKSTKSSFYAADEAASDCAGIPNAQEGQQESTTLAGGRTVSQVSAPGGGALKVTDGVTTTCGAMQADGVGTTSTTTGVGSELTTTSTDYVRGNPLMIATTSTSQGSTERTVDLLDSNGAVWKDIDPFGTRTVSTTDPVSGRTTRITETTAKGQTRTIEYTYAANGEVATVTVNGRLLLTNEYGPRGGFTRTELANGAVQVVELDANNFGKKVETTFPDGTKTTETAVRSPSGRILSRTLSGPGGTATFTYQYNVDGRLVDTKLTGTIPTSSTSWQSAYTGAEGAGGNRSSKTTTLADGTEATTAFTYGPDNRLLTASAGRIKGEIEYDAAARATRIGGVTLSYDAAGHLLSAAQADRAYAFTDGGLTTTFTRTLPDGTTTSVSASSSGQTLQLGPDKEIEAQFVGLASGISVLLDKNGAPERWLFDDMLGNMTWRTTGIAAPERTHLYSPYGEPISATRGDTPATTLDLVRSGIGWMAGGGASTLRLSVPLMIIGARVYTPEGGRWLQTDPAITASMNAYEYATGDPINQFDPSGNASMGWLWGAIASVVVGAAIGAFTFGIGPMLTASYGLAAIAAQMALGAVGGALAGAVGEIVTQAVDNGGVIDWGSVGIAAGIGAATGAVFSGGSSLATKFAPFKKLRSGASLPAEYKLGNNPFALQRGIALANQEGRDAGFFRDMFTSRGRWNPAFRKYQAKYGDTITTRQAGGFSEYKVGGHNNIIDNPFAHVQKGLLYDEIEAVGGNLATGEAHLAARTSSVISETNRNVERVIVKDNPNFKTKAFSGDYDKNLNIRKSVTSDESDSLAGSFTDQYLKAEADKPFNNFLIAQIEQQKNNFKGIKATYNDDTYAWLLADLE